MRPDVDLIYLAFPVKRMTIGNWSECALHPKGRRFLSNIFLFHLLFIKRNSLPFGFSYRKLFFIELMMKKGHLLPINKSTLDFTV